MTVSSSIATRFPSSDSRSTLPIKPPNGPPRIETLVPGSRRRDRSLIRPSSSIRSRISSITASWTGTGNFPEPTTRKTPREHLTNSHENLGQNLAKKYPGNRGLDAARRAARPKRSTFTNGNRTSMSRAEIFAAANFSRRALACIANQLVSCQRSTDFGLLLTTYLFDVFHRHNHRLRKAFDFNHRKCMVPGAAIGYIDEFSLQ